MRGSSALHFPGRGFTSEIQRLTCCLSGMPSYTCHWKKILTLGALLLDRSRSQSFSYGSSGKRTIKSRETHNQLEKNRRAQLKTCFESLRVCHSAGFALLVAFTSNQEIHDKFGSEAYCLLSQIYFYVSDGGWRGLQSRLDGGGGIALNKGK